MVEPNDTKKVKTYRTWIILNIKTGQFRVIKRKGTLKPSEVSIDLSLEVILPKPAMMVAKGKIELSSAKMADMTLEELEE